MNPSRSIARTRSSWVAWAVSSSGGLGVGVEFIVMSFDLLKILPRIRVPIPLLNRETKTGHEDAGRLSIVIKSMTGEPTLSFAKPRKFHGYLPYVFRRADAGYTKSVCNDLQ